MSDNTRQLSGSIFLFSRGVVTVNLDYFKVTTKDGLVYEK
jgi:hypothetical protein